ncbi:MAG: T9SS type A sorting domain-containing protein [Bacteroidia bacterium]|nr:T9SS type A sorting domain-containing protein [Bacteroidia bacterium]
MNSITRRFRSFIIGITMIIPFTLVAGNNWIKIDNATKTETDIKIVSSSNDETVVSFSVNAYSLKKVQTGQGYAFVVNIPEGAKIQQKGAPDLPKLAKSIIVPDDKNMTIQLVAWDYTDINNMEIAPSKGIITRDQDPATIPYTYGNEYSTDVFFPSFLTQLETPYIMRDFRGQTIVVNPVQYNPVSKTLRIYKNITVKVFATGDSETNILKRNNSQIKINSEFKSIYQNHFLNFKSATSAKYNPLPEPGKMLIICYTGFMNSMLPFIQWKKQRGMEVDMVDVSTIGNNATAIKNYVTNYFNANGLTFLLLVGDHAQVTTSNISSGDSDWDYGYLLGSDHYADILVGRFSAETVQDVVIQVDKAIHYERDVTPADSWLGKGVCIASDEGGNGQGDLDESDIVHEDFIRDTLLHYGYSFINRIYDPGATAQMLANALDSARGIISYTGHGSDNAFVTTGFSNTDVDALTNIDKLPYIFSVACVNGDFTNLTCFAEAWLRANVSGKPTGAVATLMSTINQSWNSPMCGQDEMIRLVTHNIPGNDKITFGGISINGLAKMIDNYSTDGENMADTWTVFGDPSLIVRTKTPQSMTVSHQPVTFIGTNQFTVNCDVDSAFICLTLQGEILGTGYGNGTFVNISFNTLTSPDTIIVTVTAQDYVTYIGTVLVVPNNGAYVVCQAQAVNDPNANHNHLAETGENVNLDITLKNVGTISAGNVNAVLSSADPYITITQNTHGFGQILAGASSVANDAYTFTVADNVPDNHNALFNLQVTDINDSIWISQISVPLHAPNLNLQYINLNDASGNNNGMLDPGETVDLNISVLNNSVTASTASACILSSTSSYVTINTNSVNTGVLGSNSTTPASFNISISSSAPAGSYADFTFTLTAGQYSKILLLTLPIGLIIEDWECNGFTHYSWTNTSSHPWTIDSQVKYEGAYSSKSGTIGNNATSELSIQLNVLSDDTISFYKKVSCEECYVSYGFYCDYLEFKIDNNSYAQWDGENDWSKVKYPVTAGTHILKWTYTKDPWANSGSDCAWIDNVVFPPFNTGTQIKSEKLKVESEKLEVFPNPAYEFITVSTQNSIQGASIIITDLLGGVVYEECVRQNTNYSKISIKNFPSGVYMVKVQGKGITATGKFLKW